MTFILDPENRLEVLAAICQLYELSRDNPNGVLFTEHAAYASGMMQELDLQDDELTLILKEIVGLGHATLKDFAYVPTVEGIAVVERWLAAKQVQDTAQSEVHHG